MNKRAIFIFLVILSLTISIDTKKLSRSRSSSSSRSSSKKTNHSPQPAPTSFSYPQASAPKPSLFGWQEKPAQKTQTYSSKQSNPTNTGHSYPSSNTGLSGDGQPKKTAYEENVHRSNAPVQQSVQRSPNSQTPTNNQGGHAYPASNGLSGNQGSGLGYPQGSGLSGSGVNSNPNRPQGSNVAPPPYQASNPGSAYNPGGGNYPSQNMNNQYHGAPPPYSSGGNNYYNHPQGPPPPYSFGHNYGGHGSPGGYGSQMPGYFGNYMNNGRGFGGVSRSSNALAGVGIAGAGIGTVLTGLALWNLARSTGHHHHTVIYDNRGQPVAVAPDNNTNPAVDPVLGNLVNCTLSISNDNATEVLAIPCAIATSFTPDADIKDLSDNKNANDNTKCTITVVTKEGKEFMTTIPCSVLLNTAAKNNVTEPPVDAGIGVTQVPQDQVNADLPSAEKLSTDQDISKNPDLPLNCSQEEGDIRDPINPCFSVKHDLSIIPLEATTKP